jgi:type II secretory pathway component PulC
MIRTWDDLLGRALTLLTIAAVVAGALLVWGVLRMPVASEASPARLPELAWAKPVLPPIQTWSVFKRSEGGVPASDSPLARRFRLAGTFFSFAQGANARKAVVDELSSGVQHLVGEGDAIKDIEVVSIFQDRIVLRAPDHGEETLWLSFADAESAKDKPRGAPSVQQAPGLIDGGRWGRQVDERRWVLKRQGLMDYYQEVLDDPERVAAIYESLVPDYNEDRKIEGYTVNMIGEEEFFKAVGLRNGDVIRKVNSMRMTSQRRGEYFLREFVQNRVNAIVLDIEREKKPEKVIYMIR